VYLGREMQFLHGDAMVVDLPKQQQRSEMKSSELPMS
jgi:hypothetical protein